MDDLRSAPSARRPQTRSGGFPDRSGAPLAATHVRAPPATPPSAAARAAASCRRRRQPLASSLGAGPGGWCSPTWWRCSPATSIERAARWSPGCLWAGLGAQLAGLTAARWHGLLDGPDDGVVRLLVDLRAGSSPGRRSPCAGGPRGWTRTRGAWSAGRLLTGPGGRGRRPRAGRPDDARALLIAVVQRRLVRAEDLRHELEAGAVRGSALVRRALDDVAAGAWSLPEAEVLRELGRSTVLPARLAQPAARRRRRNRAADPGLLAGRRRAGRAGALARAPRPRPGLGGRPSPPTRVLASTASWCWPSPRPASGATRRASGTGSSAPTSRPRRTGRRPAVRMAPRGHGIVR